MGMGRRAPVARNALPDVAALVLGQLDGGGDHRHHSLLEIAFASTNAFTSVPNSMRLPATFVFCNDKPVTFPNYEMSACSPTHRVV
jgi:hypothetical protein